MEGSKIVPPKPMPEPAPKPKPTPNIKPAPAPFHVEGLATVKGKPEEHRSFIKAVKKYVEKVNVDPKLSKKELRAVCYNAKVTVDEEERGGTRRVSRRTSILERVWKDACAQHPSYVDLVKEVGPNNTTHNPGEDGGVQSGYWWRLQHSSPRALWI